jgi:hypothetical protein
MGNFINEEVYRMKYLFGYQRGVVISEQDDPFESQDLQKYNWKGKKKGLMDLTNPQGVYAFNVGYDGQTYTLTSASEAIRVVSKGEGKVTTTPPEIVKEPVLRSLTLVGSAFPYPDNMVKPKFDSFPEAKKVYDSFIQSIVDFLKSANAEKMGILTIQGTADSARPTLDIPKGYSKLDHPGELYDGKKDPNEMNQYLADTRASELGKIIVQDVLDKTGVNISKNIKYNKGINYYGQQGKRGFEYKNVTVTPSKKSIEITQPDNVVTTVPPVSSGSSSSQGPKVSETFFDLGPWGGGLAPMKRLKNGNYVITTKYILDNNLFVKGGGGILNLWDATGLNETAEVKGEIKDGEMFVNGLSFGNFMSSDTQEAEYQYQAESTTKFVTKSRPMITGIRDGEAVIRLFRFALTTRR